MDFVHCSGTSRGLLERHTFKKMVQIMQQNVCFCQNRSEKSLFMKTRILNFIQVFSSKFEDRKRHFSSNFDQKLTSPWKGQFGTFAKPFVLWDLGDDSGLQAILTRFFIFFHFFPFFFFLRRRHKCVPRLGKTYNS